jgi:hypothetical protein
MSKFKVGTSKSRRIFVVMNDSDTLPHADCLRIIKKKNYSDAGTEALDQSLGMSSLQIFDDSV